jgi:hypothetical protein
MSNERDKQLVKFAVTVMLLALEEAGVLVRKDGVEELFPDSVIEDIVKTFEEQHEVLHAF